MLSEVEIKALVLNELLKTGRIKPDSMVFNELSLDKKTRRVDLGYYTGGEFVAIEIKSEKDSLFRLLGQVETYCKYFDRVILVLAERFILEVKELIGNGVEIWSVSESGIKVVRRGRKNNRVKKESYLNLMTKREVLKLAKVLAISDVNLPIFDLRRQVFPVLHRVSKALVKEIMLEGLQKKFLYSSKFFLATVISNNTVCVDDVSLLSPYAILRRD